MSSPITIEKSEVRKTPCSPGCSHPHIPKMKIEFPRRCYYPIHYRLDCCRFYSINECEYPTGHCLGFQGSYLFTDDDFTTLKCQTTSNKCLLSLSVSL